MDQYKYRAIINGNTYEPEVKKVRIVSVDTNQNRTIKVPCKDGGPYTISVPRSELFDDPQEALQSLRPQYDGLIVDLAYKMHFYVEQVNKLDKPAKVIE